MNKEEKKLIGLYGRLSQAERATLMAFAEFLAARSSEERPVPAPQPIARPEKESVIAAIKRLSATYPMIDKAQVLHETSALMSQHLMQGREASLVIDELELVFRRTYERLSPRDSER